MPDVYRNGQGIRELRGRVRGGAAVVVHSPYEVTGLVRLVEAATALPGDPMTTVYRSLTESGRDIEGWIGWSADARASGAAVSDDPHFVPAQAVQALRAAADFWKEQREDAADLALAFAVARPRRRKLRLDARRPMLVLDGGSIRARLARAGQRLRDFGVALFPVARSRRQANLVEALRARAVEQNAMPLPRLEGVSPEDLAGHKALIVFLHGLLSTDAGSFDGLIQRLLGEATFSRVFLAGWPHDTLACIGDNAFELAELVQAAVGQSKLPVMFVCHSRGGLVGRACAAKLIKIDESWRQRLRGCVTFGTPHRGAEMAEIADEFLGKVLVTQMIARGGRVVPLLDALWAVRNRKKLPGITDLRPRRNGGAFLRWLEEREAKQARRAGGRALPVLAIGGNTQGGGFAYWMSKRFLAGLPNDLVVPTISSTPSTFRPTLEAACDHFSYFQPPEQPRLDAAADFIKEHLGLEEAQHGLPPNGPSRKGRGTPPQASV